MALMRRSLIFFGLCLLGLSGKPGLIQAQQTKTVVCVGAANYDPNSITFNSIVAAFGTELATTTVSATNAHPLGPKVVLPTILGGTTVKVAGIASPLFYVSPTQVNFSVPPELANSHLAADGTAPVEVRAGNGAVSTGRITVSRWAPALFTVDGTGKGIPAGVTVRVKPGNVQDIQPLADYDRNARAWKQRGLDLSVANDRLFVALFVSGVRNAPDPNGDGNVNESVRVIINDIETVPSYVGEQPSLVGLDQINLEIPRGFFGQSILRFSIGTQGSLHSVYFSILLQIPDVPFVTWAPRGLNNQAVQHIGAAGASLYAATANKVFHSTNYGMDWHETLFASASISDTSMFQSDSSSKGMTAAVGGNRLLKASGDIPGLYQYFAYSSEHGLTSTIFAYNPLNLHFGTEAGLYRLVPPPIPPFPPPLPPPPPPASPPVWKAVSPLETTPIRSLAGNLIGTQGKGMYRLAGDKAEPITTNFAANATIGKLATWDQYVYAAWDGNGFHRSTNNGASWQPVTVPWPITDQITGIAPYGHNVVVTTRNNGVFRSNDYGTTWRPINQGLGNLHVLSVVLDDLRLAIGTENGVYVASNYLNGYGGVFPIPAARPLAFTTNEDTPKNFSLAEGETNPAIKNYFVIQRTAYGTLTGIPPNLTYTPRANYYGDDSFQYVASDGLFISKPVTVKLTINPVNDPPTLSIKESSSPIINGRLNLQLSEFLNVVFRVDDPDPGSSVITLENYPAGDVWHTESGTEFYFSTKQAGVYPLTFTATDNSGLKATLTINLNIADSPEKTAWTPRGFDKVQACNDLLISGDVMLVSVATYTFATNNGVMRSTNGGASWNLMTNGLPANAGVGKLAQSGNVILAAVENHGIYRSPDNGLTWTASNGNLPANALYGTSTLTASGNRVLLSTSIGVFLSTDQGLIWKQLNLGLANLPQPTFYFPAINSTHLFVAVNERGLYRSADNGASWLPIHQAIGTNVTNVYPLQTDGATLYAGTNGLIYRSTDQGTTWIPVATPNGKPAENFLSVGNDLFCVGLGVWVQRNNSGTWLPINQGLPLLGLPLASTRSLKSNGTQLYLLQVVGEKEALLTRPIAR